MTPKIKSALVIAAAALAVVVTGLILYGQAERRSALRWRGAADALTREYQSYRVRSDAELAALRKQQAAAEAEKKHALEAAAVAEKKHAVIQSDLQQLQALTASLSPDDLSGHINQRIGTGSIVPNAGGLYICTRAGAEAVLNHLLTGEAWQARYQAETVVSSNLRLAVDASERETAAIASRLTITRGALDRALAAWDADRLAYTHLARSIAGRQTKSFVAGAVVGIAAVLVFQLVTQGK